MKAFVYISLFWVVALLFPVQLRAQEHKQAVVYNGLVNVKQNKAEVVNGVLTLDMCMLLSGVSVGRYQTLQLIPVLRNGNKSLRLPPVRINGTNKQKMYERTTAFRGKPMADGEAYVVLKCNPQLLQEVRYTKAVSFQPWMEEAELILLGELRNYDDIPVQTYTDVLTDRLSITH